MEAGKPKPLFGRRIVVTRPRRQASPMVAALEALGAEVVPFPTIRVVPPTDPEPLRQAAREAGEFDWIVFTSVNGVEHFWGALRSVGRDMEALDGVALCAVGPATAAALRREGASAALIPGEHVNDAVVAALADTGTLNGRRILLPRADIARDVLPEQLRAHGAAVVDVTAYRTVPAAEGGAQMRRRLENGEIHMVTFTSGSTVRNFVDLVGSDLGESEVASIGPVTSAAARSLGLRVAVEAKEYTVAGLVRAIRSHYEEPLHD